jgi:transposase
VSLQPSYEELAALAAVRARVIDELQATVADQARVISELRARGADLERQLGRDSTNSSQPPSKDSIAVKARRRADLSSRERSKERRPGGQPGREGVRLEPAEKPDRTERVAAPADCAGCGADLAQARDAGLGWAQVWDILPVMLEKVAYELPRRRCGCGRVTTAVPPEGQAGTVVYGPNLNAAAVLLGSEGNVPVERTALLIESLLGVRVSPGFVARAHARLAERLEAAGFDTAMREALRAEEVLCGDESPVHVLRKDCDTFGRPLPGAPHAVTIRTPDARLIWYAPIHSRSSKAIEGLDILSGWHGYLVRDDYAGWQQFDADLAGVQQCAAHLIRACKAVLALGAAGEQGWAQAVIDILREAQKAVTAARETGADRLDPPLLQGLRERYDKAANWGLLTNRLRDWPKGNHPGHRLAKRLLGKAEQVWLFTRNFAVPWTNNASEQALRGPKRHQAVSGYWHTPSTLGAYCRVRSYLLSARGHDINPLDAVHRALTTTPWLPTAR